MNLHVNLLSYVATQIQTSKADASLKNVV